MSTATSAFESVRALGAQREEIVRELSQLSEADCRVPAEWAGLTRNVNFLLRAFSLHELDHLQHLNKLLVGRGHQVSEPQMLLAKAQALRAEVEALLLSLSDEEFDATGPNEGDWSVRQLVEHLAATDARYASQIREALRRQRGA